MVRDTAGGLQNRSRTHRIAIAVQSGQNGNRTGQIGDVGGHVSDGYAIARTSGGHIAQKTEIIRIAHCDLEHGRRRSRRRRIFHGRKNVGHLCERVSAMKSIETILK